MTKRQLKQLIDTQIEILVGLNREIGRNLIEYWGVPND